MVRRVGPMALKCRSAAQRSPLRAAMAAHLAALRPADLRVLRGITPRELGLLASYLHTVPRITGRWMLDAVEALGLNDLLRGAKDAAPEALLADARDRLGWAVEDAPARGAALGILAHLAELQLLAEHKGAYTWRGPTVVHDLGLTAAEDLYAREVHGGTLAFYRACLDALPEVLRGKPPPLRFDAAHAGLWEGVLGAPEQLLLRRIGLRSAPEVPHDALDLACGPGFSTACMAEEWVSSNIVAIDTSGHAYPAVEQRARASAAALGVPLDLTMAKPWAGWGDPLPFSERSFDAIFFPMNDGFIPPNRRTEAFAEMHRVLRPGGRVVMVSAPLPDDLVRPSAWEMRAQTRFHHAVEFSVAGFHGLATAREHVAAAEAAGLLAKDAWRFAGLVALFQRPAEGAA